MQLLRIKVMDVSHTDVMDLFNMMTSQKRGGGVYMDYRRTEMDQHIPEAAVANAISGGAGASWVFSPEKKTHNTAGPYIDPDTQRITTIYLRGAYVDGPRLSFDRMPYDYVVTAIHELVHDAPKDLDKIFDHTEMNQGAVELGAKSIDDYIRQHCVHAEYR